MNNDDLLRQMIIDGYHKIWGNENRFVYPPAAASNAAFFLANFYESSKL